VLGWIYQKLVDGKVVCDECRGGKSKTRGIQRQVLGRLEVRKTCDDDMVGFAIAGRLGRTPRMDGAGDSAAGWTLRGNILVGADLPRICAIGKQHQCEMQAGVKQYSCGHQIQWEQTEDDRSAGSVSLQDLQWE